MPRRRACEQCANGLNGLAVAANDPPNITLTHLQLEDRHLTAGNFREHDLIRKFDQLANDKFKKLFQGEKSYSKLRKCHVWRLIGLQLKPARLPLLGSRRCRARRRRYFRFRGLRSCLLILLDQATHGIGRLRAA